MRDGVCVLGVHRGGGSLVAGILHGLGVFVGDEDDLGAPGAGNVGGDWELQEVVALNDELLLALGGAWNSVPQLEDGWHASPDLEPLRKRARNLLFEQFGDARQWCWKDPRTCLTLPFWQQLVPGMRYVICIRNPIDVARSLRALQGEEAPLEHHVANWLRYTALALEHTSGRPRIVVHYDEFLSELEPTVGRIAQFAGLEHQLEDPDVRDRVNESVDPSLILFRTPPAVAAADARASAEAAALYNQLRLLRRVESSPSSDLDAIASEWEAVDRLARRLRIGYERVRMHTDRPADADQRLEKMTSRNVALKRKLEHKRTQLRERKQELEKREKQMAELREAAAELQLSIAQERERVAEADNRLSRAQDELDVERGEVERLSHALDDRDARLEAQKRFIRDQQLEMQLRDAQHRQIVEGMRNSRSWRITRPMRRVGSIFRRPKKADATDT